MALNSTYERFQKALLAEMKGKIKEPLKANLENDFLSRPRHRFVKAYYTFYENQAEKVSIDENNLEEQLPILYKDTYLPLVDNLEKYGPSTISQPTLVLIMLDLLQIQEGQTIFEIGAASGWNASLMSNLVGERGHIYSVEIISSLAVQTREVLKTEGINNVTMYTAPTKVPARKNQWVLKRPSSLFVWSLPS